MLTVRDLASCEREILARPSVRVILVAGASCSGKTHLSRELARDFADKGFPTLHLTLDDYYVGAERNPRDENGEFDFETPDALDAGRVTSDLAELLSGGPVRLHRYDFASHAIWDDAEATVLPRGARIVIEGIHAFNPVMTSSLPEDVKCRVFVEPSSEAEGIAPDGLRLMRRIVRDAKLRSIGPCETVRTWPKVLAGESRWLHPFRDRADFTYDSSSKPEWNPLVRSALPLLEMASKDNPNDETIKALLSACHNRNGK